MKILFIFIMSLLCTCAYANDLQFQYISPSFNGNGYTAQVLGIEQIQEANKQNILNQQAAAAANAAAAKAADPVNQFMSTLNSMIYQQLAQQITATMFGQSNATSGAAAFNGTTISWSKASNGTINLTIQNANGITTLNVPANSFYF